LPITVRIACRDVHYEQVKTKQTANGDPTTTGNTHDARGSGRLTP